MSYINDQINFLLGPVAIHNQARAKPERAASIHMLWRGFPPIFSEMAGLIRSGLYRGNDRYMGENKKFIKLK